MSFHGITLCKAILPVRFKTQPALVTDWNWYNSYFEASEMMLCPADC
jgi:hypothetical protein